MSEPLTDECLAELRALLDRLPDGPWMLSDREGELQVWPESALYNVSRDEHGQITGYRTPGDLSALLYATDLDTWDPGQDEHDDLKRDVARLLVTARDLLPALLAEVERLRGVAASADHGRMLVEYAGTELNTVAAERDEARAEVERLRAENAAAIETVRHLRVELSDWESWARGEAEPDL